MLPDLQLSEWSAPEDGLTAEREEWFWGQALWFAPKAADTKEKPAKQRRKATGAAASAQTRRASLANLRAVDNALRQADLGGLQSFVGGPPLSAAGPLPRTLVVHFDEASTNLAMALFLQHHLKLRMAFVRDVFHRQWNDLKS